LTLISTLAIAPDSSSMRTSWGSSNPAGASELRRGFLTSIETIRSPASQGTVSNSWTTESVISIDSV